jgi:hypothetical protein
VVWSSEFKVHPAHPHNSHALPPPTRTRTNITQGHAAAWNGQGPQILLLHVMLEMADALSEDHITEMLDKVREVHVWSSRREE